MVPAIITKQVNYSNAEGKIKYLHEDDSVLLTFIPRATTVVMDCGEKKITRNGSFWAVLEDTALVLEPDCFRIVD